MHARAHPLSSPTLTHTRRTHPTIYSTAQQDTSHSERSRTSIEEIGLHRSNAAVGNRCKFSSAHQSSPTAASLPRDVACGLVAAYVSWHGARSPPERTTPCTDAMYLRQPTTIYGPRSPSAARSSWTMYHLAPMCLSSCCRCA